MASIEDADHAVPFQWTAVPLSPTAQTSVALDPHAARRLLNVPLIPAAPADDHPLPFQCAIVPNAPNIQASFALVPQRAKRSLPCGSGLLHLHPLQSPGKPAPNPASDGSAATASAKASRGACVPVSAGFEASGVLEAPGPVQAAAVGRTSNTANEPMASFDMYSSRPDDVPQESSYHGALHSLVKRSSTGHTRRRLSR
jgi:hypothetical protein